MRHATRNRVAPAPEVLDRTRCLLAARHAETGLLSALRRVLVHELPDIEFLLGGGGPPPDSVWICGYDPGDVGLVRELRRSHPRARLLVTRCGGEGWGAEAVAAGADDWAPWPMPLGELANLLRLRRGA